MNDIQQEQKGADTKNSKLEGKSPTMIAKSEVPKQRTSEGDGRMRNENGKSHQETQLNDYVM